MSDFTVKPQFLGLSALVAALLLIAVTTAFRLFYAAWLPVLPDETYYLQWAHHLDLSYISKGPLVAWTIAASTAFFGDNNFGIRFFAVLLSAGTAWQIFVLARRWYDEVTALMAVLITGVVPLYAIGSVVMTIDPLSAFFWLWAANCFSRALQKHGLTNWVLAGFAVGCGFLAKYLNALELVSFLAFLLIVPSRRKHLKKQGFWLMVLVACVCTTPVLLWNAQHDWIGFGNLMNRGHLGGHESFKISPSTFLEFLGMQAVVMSPLLFVAMAASIGISFARKFKHRNGSLNDGEIFLFVLFVPVFLMYAVLSWHLHCEPNWPAVSYFSLLIILASHWRKLLLARKATQPFVITTFVVAWLQTLLMQDTTWLPMKANMDPMSRVAGWREIAMRLDDLRGSEHAKVFVADAYKEASVFSYYLPNLASIYTLRHDPPANQYDLWPGYPTRQRTLWITGEATPVALQGQFKMITWLERDEVYFRGKKLRSYDVYLCENPPEPAKPVASPVKPSKP
jgi:4-amino-4-deoxy-L-arabinose transferase-like glycosyltransferase